jgi:hypothetical protein
METFRGFGDENSFFHSSSFFSNSCELFCNLLHFFALAQNSSLLFSNDSALFAQKHAAGGAGILTSQTSSPCLGASVAFPFLLDHQFASLPHYFVASASPDKRTVAFPQHSTPRPLKKAPLSRTIEAAQEKATWVR